MGLPISNIDLTIAAPPRPQSAARVKPADGPPQPKGAQLLAKMAQAMGGDAKLLAIKDMTEKAELSLDAGAGGLKAQQTAFWLAPSQYREENVLPFGKVATYSDGQSGWVSSPQGSQPIPDAERKQVSFEIFRMWFPLMASASDSNRKIEDEGNGVIRISDKNGNTVLLTIDPATALPQSENYSEAGSSGSDVMETYSDWQETNGVKLPHSITITQNGKHFADVKVTSVMMNQGLTPDLLSKKP
jgi:hypothetical protein